MNQADRQVFALELTLVAEYKRLEVTPELLQGYFEDLGKYDLAEVVAAIRVARRELIYFPQPAEIIELVRAARTQRLALDRATQKALPPPALTAEEVAQAEEAKTVFFRLIRDLAERMHPDATARPVFPPVPEDDLAKHRMKKQAALERAKGVL